MKTHRSCETRMTWKKHNSIIVNLVIANVSLQMSVRYSFIVDAFYFIRLNAFLCNGTKLAMRESSCWSLCGCFQIRAYAIETQLRQSHWEKIAKPLALKRRYFPLRQKDCCRSNTGKLIFVGDCNVFELSAILGLVSTSSAPACPNFATSMQKPCKELCSQSPLREFVVIVLREARLCRGTPAKTRIEYCWTLFDIRTVKVLHQDNTFLFRVQRRSFSMGRRVCFEKEILIGELYLFTCHVFVCWKLRTNEKSLESHFEKDF